MLQELRLMLKLSRSSVIRKAYSKPSIIEQYKLQSIPGHLHVCCRPAAERDLIDLRISIFTQNYLFSL